MPQKIHGEMCKSKETSGVGHNQSAYGTFAWTELDPYAAFIYAFGDLNCHTKSERSWVINGNQMPVCVRDVGFSLVWQLAVSSSLDVV